MRPTLVVSGACAALVAIALVSLAVGPLSVGMSDLLQALVGEGTPDAETALHLRGPRVGAAVFVGAGLALAGAAFQSVFRNPLVAPDLLGVSSGSALGASLALLLGVPLPAVQASAFAGGVAAVTLALGSARAAGGRDPRLALVLCGLVVGALASAGLALVIYVADPYTQLPTISYWLLGSLSRAGVRDLLFAAGPAGFGAVLLLMGRTRLDVLALGDEQARALGVPAGRVRALIVAGATLVTSTAVSLAGVVGWIGLLAPHAARLLVGSEARRLLPASALLGAIFVLAIDLLARTAGPVEIPLGLLAAAVGAPAFLALFVWTGRGR